MDGDLTADVHNEVDARSCMRSFLLEISAQCRCIINPGLFLTGGMPGAIRGDRDAVPLQYWSPSTASLPLQRIIYRRRLPRGEVAISTYVVLTGPVLLYTLLIVIF